MSLQPYAPEIETTMKNFYDSLNEKDRRRYAGIEALKLGRGGRNYIARVLGCSRRTVTKGAQEVSGLSQKDVSDTTSSKKTFRNWQMKSVWLFGLLIIRPIVPSTIPLSTVCSLT